MLDVVHGHHVLELAEQRAIATVFLATVLELLFEVHLWDLLRRLGTPEKVASLLLDAYRGRERRIYLYNQLARRPLTEVFESADLPHFLAGWKQLAEARNETVHGDWKGGYDLDMETIKYIRDRCFDAFAAMHEDARQTVAHGGNTDSDMIQ